MNKLRLDSHHGAVLLLDKPQGITSNTALQKVKRLLGVKKAGHTGSLDPLATGMLPICLGQATKFSQYGLNANKRYRVTGRLGIQTTTADAEGDVIAERPIPELTAEKLEPMLAKFRGTIEQIPSMYSALKHQGKPLYQWAREGVTIERPAREVTITQLTLLNLTSNSFELNITCSKGTYIRNLVEDMGNTIGCGAHVTQLRRLAVGSYRADKMLTLERIESLKTHDEDILLSYLLPITSLFPSHLSAFEVSQSGLFYLRQGQPIVIPMQHPLGFVQIMHEGEFYGMGEINVPGKLIPRRLLAC